MQSRSRAVASNRQNDTLASVIFLLLLLFLSHYKHPKFPGRELHHGNCLSHNSDTTSVSLFLARAL